METEKKAEQRKLKEAVSAEILARAELMRKEKGIVRSVLLTLKEAAKYLRIEVPTFYEIKDSIPIPHFKPPKGKILFDSAVLDDFLNNSKTGGY